MQFVFINNSISQYTLQFIYTFVAQGKAIPLKAWTVPEGSRRLRLPEYEGCQPYAPAAFIPQETFLVIISVRG
jgi:hypothetical protein